MSDLAHPPHRLTRRRLLQGGMAALGASALGASGFGALRAAAAPRSADAADLILFNANVLTVDPAFTVARAVAVRDGAIIAVGGHDDVMRYSGSGTRRINLQGRTVIPGLIDSHVHQRGAALNALHVDLIDARSIADVQEKIAERVAITPAGEWVRASSAWHESILAEGRLPTRHDLDPVSPDNPVFIPRGGHVATVNSRALELAGVDRDTPDPDGGTFVRDADGEPTGVLFQAARGVIARLLPSDPPPEEQGALLEDYMQELNSYGITGVTEPGVSGGVVDLYRGLWEAGRMTVRTHLLISARNLNAVQNFVDTYEHGFGNPMLRIDGVKTGVDGGVEGARLYEPYQIVEGEQTDPNYRGFLFLPPGGRAELFESWRLLAEHGWQLQTHAVGDESIDVAVETYAQVDDLVRLRDLRWCIMHIFLPTRSAIETMAARDILATAQNHPLLLGHNQLRYWGEERAAYAIPIRDLLDAGILVGGGTDAPVLPIDPFLSIWWMVTRQTLDRQLLGPEQGISIREAMQLYTINSAYTQFAEDVKGSIEVGKLADLAVLSDDPLRVPADHLRDVHAQMTIVGGEIVYDEADAPPRRRRSTARPGLAAAAATGPVWTPESGWRVTPQQPESSCCPA